MTTSMDDNNGLSRPRGHVQPLLQTRERREHAGSKMAKLLAQEIELEEDELFAEEANDAEFITKAAEERDMFDSDFANTSSATSDDSSDDEEGAIAAEERAERRAGRQSRVLPTVPGGKLRGRQTQSDHAPRPSKRRRLSPGGTSFIGGGSLGERASARTSSQVYKQSIDERLEAEEAKRLSQVVRIRAKQSMAPKRRAMTQAELVAEALETEELNKASLQAFYAAEEERKDTQARAGRSHRIFGPAITFISRTCGPISFGTEETASVNASLTDVRMSRNSIALRDMDVSAVHVMGAVLGYHAEWTMTPVRPQSIRSRCAITGDLARYREPRSGAPYASLAAFRLLQEVEHQSFGFAQTLGCFSGSVRTVRDVN